MYTSIQSWSGTANSFTPIPWYVFLSFSAFSEGLNASGSLQCLPFVAYGMTGFMVLGLSIINNNVIIKDLE